jgi:hypothetical protein
VYSGVEVFTVKMIESTKAEWVEAYQEQDDKSKAE